MALTSRRMATRTLVLLLLNAHPASSRRVVAALLNGRNCTQRLDSGECILNPYFMKTECEGLCESLTFVDALHNCESQLHMCYGRSRSGMLRKPEAFVRKLCNHTCREHFEMLEYNMAPGNVTLVLHALLPALYWALFCVVAFLQLLTTYADGMLLWLEPGRASGNRMAAAVQSALLRVSEWQERRGSPARRVGRLYVCGYFVVEGGPIFAAIAVAAFALPKGGKYGRVQLLAVQAMIAYSCMEAATVMANVAVPWLMTGRFYMNELMVKKLALLGVLLLFHAVPADGSGGGSGGGGGGGGGGSTASAEELKQALPGGAEPSARSAFLEARVLAARLMMASLFGYVGLVDLLRIMRGELHDPPDGHDVMWPKVVEFVLVRARPIAPPARASRPSPTAWFRPPPDPARSSPHARCSLGRVTAHFCRPLLPPTQVLPFFLGFKTGGVCVSLAASLVLEAMTAWTYWREQTRDIPTLFHSMHSKDHFATNVAVAGGLLLLQHDGGGKYTLDSYLKKKD